MATWQHLRSSTANKRPTTSLADGRIAINTNTASPGLFFKDSAGTGIVKVGPVHVGTTAPNSVPAAGGSTGNYLGEQWLDTSVSPAQMKVWNGSTWIGVVADELPVSKLQDGAARQLIQTDAAGTGVEWTSNIDVPGTLDVTSTATFDSIAQHPLGTAGAPTITFTGDNNTGIYSPGADQVAISTGGSGRLFVDASGRVGVGTTSPRHNLSIGSTAITSTASPDTIDLGGTFSNTAGSNLKLRIYWDGTTAQGFGISASQMDYVAASNAAHVFYRGASEAVRIDASSRLLVGTSSARSNYFGAASGEACQLQVEGNDYKTGGASFTSTNNSIAGWGPHIALGRSRGGSIGTNGLVSNGDGTGSIIFHGNDGSSFVQSARIDAFVDGTPGTNDMPGRLVFSTTADGASSPTERMRITQAGHVFVGNVTGDYNTVGISLFSNGNLQAVTNQIPTLVLNRKGSDGVIVDFYRDTNNPGTISVTTTATSYNTSSDYRLKENVTPVTDGITRLQQLKPSRFNFIAAPGCTVDGFIAHEVQSVVPEAITGEKDAVDADGKPQYQGIDQSKLVPLLTAALQEAIGEIESLKARVAALESA